MAEKAFTRFREEAAQRVAGGRNKRDVIGNNSVLQKLMARAARTNDYLQLLGSMADRRAVRTVGRYGTSKTINLGSYTPPYKSRTRFNELMDKGEGIPPEELDDLILLDPEEGKAETLYHEIGHRGATMTHIDTPFAEERDIEEIGIRRGIDKHWPDYRERLAAKGMTSTAPSEAAAAIADKYINALNKRALRTLMRYYGHNTRIQQQSAAAQVN